MADMFVLHQKDIDGLRNQLDRPLGQGEELDTAIAEQNAVLRRRLRTLGKAVYDFVNKATEG